MATVQREGKRRKVSTGDGFLSGITDEPESSVEEGCGIVLYGMEGVGKSSFAACAPNPIFLVGKDERGIHRLLKYGLVPSSFSRSNIGPDLLDWDNAKAALTELRDGEHDYESAVVDSMMIIQQFVFSACCREVYDGNMGKGQGGFMNFENGPKIVAQEWWPEFTNLLSDLKKMRGMNVILIAHTAIKEKKNPEGLNWDRVVGDLHPKLWDATKRWADCVLYLKHNIQIEKEDNRPITRAKGIGGSDRILCTEWDAAYDAKNGYGMPSIIEPFSSAQEGWDRFWEYIHPAETKPKKKTRPLAANGRSE